MSSADQLPSLGTPLSCVGFLGPGAPPLAPWTPGSHLTWAKLSSCLPRAQGGSLSLVLAPGPARSGLSSPIWAAASSESCDVLAIHLKAPQDIEREHLIFKFQKETLLTL